MLKIIIQNDTVKKYVIGLLALIIFANIVIGCKYVSFAKDYNLNNVTESSISEDI